MCKSTVNPIALTSQALVKQSSHYPPSWRGKVPRKVIIVITVHPDMPFLAKPGTCAHGGEEYYVTVNSHGAVAAILPDGERLGLKPYEFEVTEWH